MNRHGGERHARGKEWGDALHIAEMKHVQGCVANGHTLRRVVLETGGEHVGGGGNVSRPLHLGHTAL